MLKTENGYIRVPRRLVSDPSLNSSDVRVLAILMATCTSSNEIAGGLDEISENTGLTKRTVCKVLNRLEIRGFISKISRRGPYPGIIRLNSSVGQFRT